MAKEEGTAIEGLVARDKAIRDAIWQGWPSILRDMTPQVIGQCPRCGGSLTNGHQCSSLFTPYPPVVTDDSAEDMVAQTPPNAFYAAFWFLYDHPIFRRVDARWPDHTWSGFHSSLDLFVAAVNPATRAVDDDPALNTVVEVWLEAGPWVDEPPTAQGYGEFHGWSHDTRLDVGADSFEEAIVLLAAAVRCHYRDDGTEIEEEESDAEG